MQIGNVEIYMGPSQLGAPDDLEAAIVKFIDGAEKRLEVAVQELDNETIAKALIRARRRKCLVKIVLEGSYLSVDRARAKPFEAGGTNESNRYVHDAILRANIDVKTDFNPNIFHQKFIVRDRSAVLTGSTNFTPTGTAQNLNHVIIVRDRDIAKIYAREYKEIQQGHFGKLNEGHDPVPARVDVSNVPIRVVFAPDHNPEMEIMKQMQKAKRRIDFAIFTFAQSSGIDDTMIALAGAGRKIRGALDGLAANQRWAATRPVRNAGAELHLVYKKGQLNKLHHKLMVLDEQVVIAGSFNYTGPATRLNDENVMILGDLSSTKASSITAQKKLAGYALDEIDRIIEQHGKEIH